MVRAHPHHVTCQGKAYAMKSLAIIFVAFSLAVGAACADDLLDSVLDEAPPIQQESASPSEHQAATSSPVEVKPVRPQKASNSSLTAPFGEKKQPPKQVPFQHVENPWILYVRGGCGKDAFCGSIDLIGPLGHSDFDLRVRGFFLRTQKEMVRHWWDGRQWPEDVDQDNLGGETFCIWRPLRGRTFSPFVGAGLRVESIDGTGDEWAGIKDGSNASPCGCAGITVVFGRVSLLGEVIGGSDSQEVIGDLSFYITQRLRLHAFAEGIILDLADSTALGAGLSYDF